jgi:type I restriction enzyme M protein
MDLRERVCGLLPTEEPKPRTPTWGESAPGLVALFGVEEPARRDKLNMDNHWLMGTSLEDFESLHEPDVLAEKIADDLLAATDQFVAIATELKE